LNASLKIAEKRPKQLGGFNSRVLALKVNSLMTVVATAETHIGGLSLVGDRSSSVVKVLCYKSEGRWFDPSWCYWNLSLT